MTVRPAGPWSDPPPRLEAVILDVDGVLLASPHERAWREALRGIADPARLTTALYQAEIAGKPRLDGAVASLRALGVTDAERLAPAYAATKQTLLETLVRDGAVRAFADAMRFVAGLRAMGRRMAVASSSRNADAMLRSISMGAGESLLDMFDADSHGGDLAHGKPDPEIFLLAARSLGTNPGRCVVVEDAPAGIEAARRGGMTALGVARLGDEAGLRGAGADLVVTSLDEVSLRDLQRGRLVRQPARTV